MRRVVLILVTLQLLLNGVAGLHIHADANHNVPAGHVNRPHIHISGHSHRSGHAHSKHGHSHRAVDENQKSVPVAPSHKESEHDRDAVYVSCDFTTVSSPRVSVPDPHATFEIMLATDAVNPMVGVCLTRNRNDGSSAPGSDARFRLLPHLLRV